MRSDLNGEISTPSAYEELVALLVSLPKELAALREENHRLREENQALRDEVARLKGQKGKPSIRPSRLNPKRKPRRRRGGRRRNKPPVPLQIDVTEFVAATNVPAGSGLLDRVHFDVQELVIRTVTTRYCRERWLTPDGKVITAALPAGATVDGSHFGPTLHSYILYQYHHAQVTEPLLYQQLRDFGVRISTGQLHRLITEGKERFHREKDEILRVGLRVSTHIHTDDTGARHGGKNGYCTHIGNPWFAWFESTPGKSRINFLGLLRGGATNYVLRGEALEYMLAQKLPGVVLSKLASHEGEVFGDEAAWNVFLTATRIVTPRHAQIVTEGALLGAALSNGLNPKLAIVSDDAGQFNVLCHALCWIHAERVLAKLVGFNGEQRKALKAVRTTLWALYRDLKAYKEAPTATARKALSRRFDELCATRTCFTSLNHALDRMANNKPELLRVLGRPDLPLHNNLSEGDIREYVKRRKLSGGTRSPQGRRCRDTFASLKKTCRKLEVAFWDFVNDRVRQENRIPPLGEIIEARARAATTTTKRPAARRRSPPRRHSRRRQPKVVTRPTHSGPGP